MGSSAAGRVIHLAAPPLRLRYRHGVYIDLRGYPDWHPYAAAMVTVPSAPPGLSANQVRVFRVVTANQLIAAATSAMTPAGCAPAGWVWAHLGRTEAAASVIMALVPAELHGAFRHRGAVADIPAPNPGAPGSGTDASAPAPVAIRPAGTVSAEAVAAFESWLGYRLPDSYRDFLAATNGGRPAGAATLAGSGIVADQPWFGLAAPDRMHDVAYANLWMRDRLAPGYLAIGYVQGGLLVLRARGEDAGSVWHWDDDDRRDDERYQPDIICRDLLRPCAPDVADLCKRLSPVPDRLLALAARSIASGAAKLVPSEGMGAALPRSHRPEWVSRLASEAHAVR